jgi:hypothetical protein
VGKMKQMQSFNSPTGELPERHWPKQFWPILADGIEVAEVTPFTRL